MAYLSRSYYPGDGTTTDFSVDFPYLDRTHVQVYINGVLTTAWTWLDGSHIRFTSAPASGAVILIRRLTSPNARLVDYVSPSSLNESDLDTDSLQGFYLAQEANDQANAGIADDPATGQFTAGGKRVTNVADPVDDTDAATKGWSLTALVSPIAQAIAKAAEAAASAVAAAASATLAGTREANAAASATAAASSATAAAGSATAAAGSETAAATSAGTATTKAAEAATSAGNAASSASTAAGAVTTTSGHVTTTTTKAAEASASADAAAASAADAAAAAGSLTPVEDQINSALDTPFQNADMLVARQATDGALIKRSWSNIKALIWTSIGGGINGRPAKTTVVDADVVAIADSEDATNGKKVAFSTVLTYLVGKAGSAADFLSNTAGKLLTAAGVWSAADFVPLWGGAATGNLTLDFATFINGKSTITGNITFNAVSNLKLGQSGVITFWNDATYTLSVNTTYFKTANGAALNISAGRNLISYIVDFDGKVFVAVAGRAVA